MITHALTLSQPWATWVASGRKMIENRVWHPAEKWLGQRVAIHAGAKWDPRAVALLRSSRLYDDIPEAQLYPGAHVKGAILGTVRIDDWHTLELGGIQDGEERWAFGPWCWRLSAPRLLETPIPCAGALSIWRLPGKIAAKLHAEVFA